MHELIKFRFIEKVWAPSDSSSTGRVLCVRLVTDSSTASTSNVDIAEPGAGDDPKEDEGLVGDMPSTGMRELEYSENAARGMLTAVQPAPPPPETIAIQNYLLNLKEHLLLGP